MWTIYFTTAVDPISGDVVVKWQTAATRDEALHAAKSLQTDPSIRVSKISGPDNEVLTAEELLSLLQEP
jgi:hypothetical protein